MTHSTCITDKRARKSTHSKAYQERHDQQQVKISRGWVASDPPLGFPIKTVLIALGSRTSIAHGEWTALCAIAVRTEN
jgi:hypothetical protein